MIKKVAIVQVPPIFMDLKKTIALSCELIAKAATNNAGLIMFPEAYIPGYPAWIWRLRPSADFEKAKVMHRLLIENSVDLSKDGLKQIRKAAKDNNITVAIGINELNMEDSGTTFYNSFAIIGADGKLANVHRKLVPTVAERMTWGRGDASGMNVLETPAGKIGSLICWENYMPLSRYALYTQGIELYLAPTWDYGENWIGTMGHIARESGCWVASCATPFQGNDVPDSFPYKKEVFPNEDEWFTDGDAVLINPFGKIVAGPMKRKKGILYGEYDLQDIIDRRRSLDVAGHYSRPDIFNLTVRKSKQPLINIT